MGKKKHGNVMYQIYPFLGSHGFPQLKFRWKDKRWLWCSTICGLKMKLLTGEVIWKWRVKKRKNEIYQQYIIQILCSKILDLQQTQLYCLAGHDMSICIAVWLNELAKLTNNGYPRSGERIHVFLIWNRLLASTAIFDCWRVVNCDKLG